MKQINETGLFLKIIFTGIITIGLPIINSDIFAVGLATIDYNYINDHIGDRATGMGGAYTAISDDPSGAYYNPAGLVFAFDNQISLSVNSYKQKHIEFEKAVAEKPYTQDIASFYPSFFGIVQSLGPLKLAFTILNINNEILDQDDYFSDVLNDLPFTFNINYNITDNLLLGGFSVSSFFFSDSVSIGFTAFGLRRRNEQIANQLVTITIDNQTSYEITNQYITEEIYGSIFKFGVQFMPFDSMSIGVCLEQGKILSHDTETQIFQKETTDAGDFADVSFSKSKFSTNNDKLPFVARSGVAFFVNKYLTVSADVIAHIGRKYYQNNVRDTYNAAMGIEYFVIDSFPIRLGVFTNNANTPKIDKTKTNQEMHVDLYGTSGSLSWQTKSSSISLSGFYQYGEGESQLFRGVKSVQDTKVTVFSISLTGTAKY